MNILFTNLLGLIGIYLKECILLGKVLPMKRSLAVLCSNIHKSEELKRHLTENGIQQKESDIYYSFWFYDCIYLAWMKKQGLKGRYFSRTHGGDLFEERSSLFGNILFRNFQLKYLDSVFSVSEMGMNYLQKKYMPAEKKIQCSYLGSAWHSYSSPFDGTQFTIVSCAKIRDIKRIHLIAETLMYIDFPINWYHLGDENLNAENDGSIQLYLDAKERLKQNPNVRFIAKGLMSNDSILEFYKTHPVNLFISLSEAEGIPVSMMEAISYGIPVLSTDVGACKEIVNSQTGLLIDKDSQPEYIAERIGEIRNSEMNKESFRTKTRKYWEEHFNEEQNYSSFFKLING
jgi:glycosyltransferase involved in cell wall biosynthesis